MGCGSSKVKSATEAEPQPSQQPADASQAAPVVRQTAENESTNSAKPIAASSTASTTSATFANSTDVSGCAVCPPAPLLPESRCNQDTAHVQLYIPNHLQSLNPVLPSVIVRGACLFLDISGMSALMSSSPVSMLVNPKSAGNVRDVINSFVAPLFDVLSAFGGSIERFSGDALIVIFDRYQDESDEDCVGRCVTAALHVPCNLADAVAGCPQELQVTFQACITYGDLTVLHFMDSLKTYRRLLCGDPINEIADVLACVVEPSDISLSSFVTRICRASGIDVVSSTMDRNIGILAPARSNAKRQASMRRQSVALVDAEDMRLSLDAAMYFLDPALRSCIRSGQDIYLAQIRSMTILYLSVRDATLDEQCEMVAHIDRLVLKYEATVLNMLFDDRGLNVVIGVGYPLEHARDDVIALYLALDIDRMNMDSSIGIASGTVFVGVVGSPRTHRELIVLGDVVTCAAKICLSVETGCAVSETICDACRSLFEFDCDQDGVFTLQGVIDEDIDFNAAPSDEDSRPLNELLQWICRVPEQLKVPGGVRELLGPSGCGKSALVRRFASHARSLQFAVLTFSHETDWALVLQHALSRVLASGLSLISYLDDTLPPEDFAILSLLNEFMPQESCCFCSTFSARLLDEEPRLQHTIRLFWKVVSVCLVEPCAIVIDCRLDAFAEAMIHHLAANAISNLCVLVVGHRLRFNCAVTYVGISEETAQGDKFQTSSIQSNDQQTAVVQQAGKPLDPENGNAGLGMEDDDGNGSASCEGCSDAHDEEGSEVTQSSNDSSSSRGSSDASGSSDADVDFGLSQHGERILQIASIGCKYGGVCPVSILQRVFVYLQSMDDASGRAGDHTHRTASTDGDDNEEDVGLQFDRGLVEIELFGLVTLSKVSESGELPRDDFSESCAPGALSPIHVVFFCSASVRQRVCAAADTSFKSQVHWRISQIFQHELLHLSTRRIPSVQSASPMAKGVLANQEVGDDRDPEWTPPPRRPSLSGAMMHVIHPSLFSRLQVLQMLVLHMSDFLSIYVSEEDPDADELNRLVKRAVKFEWLYVDLLKSTSSSCLSRKDADRIVESCRRLSRYALLAADDSLTTRATVEMACTLAKGYPEDKSAVKELLLPLWTNYDIPSEMTCFRMMSCLLSVMCEPTSQGTDKIDATFWQALLKRIEESAAYFPRDIVAQVSLAHVRLHVALLLKTEDYDPRTDMERLSHVAAPSIELREHVLCGLRDGAELIYRKGFVSRAADAFATVEDLGVSPYSNGPVCALKFEQGLLPLLRRQKNGAHIGDIESRVERIAPFVESKRSRMLLKSLQAEIAADLQDIEDHVGSQSVMTPADLGVMESAVSTAVACNNLIDEVVLRARIVEYHREAGMPWEESCVKDHTRALRRQVMWLRANNRPLDLEHCSVLQNVFAVADSVPLPMSPMHR